MFKPLYNGKNTEHIQMKDLIQKDKEKGIIVGLTAILAMAGFQTLSQIISEFEIGVFIATAFLFYSILLFLQAFVFDLHIKRADGWLKTGYSAWHSFRNRFGYMVRLEHYVHFQNYLILPGILYWMTVILLYLNPFDLVQKQVWILLSTLSLTIVFWYMKAVFYSHSTAGGLRRQLIFIVKLYAVYIAYAATFGILRYFGFDAETFAAAVFAVTFLLLYQAMFQHHMVGFQTLKFLLLIGGTMAGLAAILYLYWTVNYFSGALVLAAVYNAVWGLTHHHFMEKNLSRVIVYEYLAVLFVVLVFVFSVTNFAERI